MTNTPQRGSRTSSPTGKDAPTTSMSHSFITDERGPSPSGAKPATKPISPREEGEVPQLPPYPGNRHQGRRLSSGAKHVHGTDFVKKNRQACKKCENFTGVPRLAGEPGRKDVGAALVFPPRTKLGRPPVIGDEIGTPSMFGSSFFMGPGHYGVREPFPLSKALAKTPKRPHSHSSNSNSNSSNSNSNNSNSNSNNSNKSSD